jgi:hypothetical protein
MSNQVIFLGRQRQQRLAERTLDGAQLLLGRLLFLGAALLFDDLDELSLERLQRFAQRRIRRVVDETRTRAWREVDERRIDVALQAAQGPRRTGKIVQQGKVLDHACAVPEQCHAIAVGRLAEIQLGIDVADPCAQCRQLMQQPALVLARLDGVLLTREPVDDVDTDAGLPDTVAQLRREIPLDLFSRQTADAIEQRRNPYFRAAVTEQRAHGRDHIGRIAFAHDHLVGAPVVAGRRYAELVAHRPEAQQADPELAL